MNLKKLICLLMALMLVLALVSCNKGGLNDALDKNLNGDETDPSGSGNDDFKLTDFSNGLDDNGHYTGVRALDYVTLPEFGDLEIPEFDRIYDEDRAIEDGDFVNIDFVGSVDGVEFQGGSTDGEGYDIVVGLTSFIDDFIEQLKGHTPGENFDIEVTFPENYGKDELNGKDAVFNITINYIWDITDEAADAIGFDGKEGMGQYVAYYGYTVEQLIEDPEFSVFFAAAQCREVPDSVLSCVREQLSRMIELNAASYGVDAGTYVQYFYGASSLKEYLDYQSQSEAEYYLIYQAVAERDGIAVTDADITEAGYDEYVETYGRPYVAYVLLQDLVAEHVVENM